eukprot:9503195-Pyramimonas_sp.AAC.3
MSARWRPRGHAAPLRGRVREEHCGPREFVAASGARHGEEAGARAAGGGEPVSQARRPLHCSGWGLAIRCRHLARGPAARCALGAHV